MKKTTVLNAIATFYLVFGIFSITFLDGHMGLCILTFLSFLGADRYHSLAENIKHDEWISLSLYEGTGND